MSDAASEAFRQRMLSAVRYFASAPDLNDARRELAALLAYGPGAQAVFDEIVEQMATAGSLPRPTLTSLRAFAVHVRRTTSPRTGKPGWLDLPPDDGAADETVLLGSEDEAAAPADADTRAGTPPADPDEDPELPRGTVCAGRYTLEEPIAIGGMSTVYRAIDDRDGKLVAVKILRRSLADDPDVVSAFEREADNAWALQDPRFVRVLAQGWLGSQPFLALEHLDGQSLGAAMKGQFATGAPWPVVRRILTTVGSAMAYAHSRGLVHADLKPGNIFLPRHGGPKVLDLGAAQFLHGDARLDLERDRDPTGAPLTPTYASAEMLLGAAAEPRDDIFALAVIGYELLTGRHPFDRYSADRARHLDIRPTRPRGVPGYAWRTLRRGLALRRDRRPPRMTAFVAGLQPPFPTVTVAGCLIGLALIAGTTAWLQDRPEQTGRYVEIARQSREFTLDLLGLRPLPARPADSLGMARQLAETIGWEAPRARLVAQLTRRLEPELLAADPPGSLERGVWALTALRRAGLLEADADATLAVTRSLVADLTELLQDSGPLSVDAAVHRLDLLRQVDPDAVRVIAPHVAGLLNERRSRLQSQAELERFYALAIRLTERFPEVPPPVRAPR